MKQNAKMKFQSWRTTDEEERAKRRERATVESMKVKSIDAADGFGIYEVSHPAADRRTAKYRVEIRSLDEPVNTCDCPDFAKSGLGTCKHIERAVKYAARKCGKLRRSPCAEVFMGRDPYEPRLVVPDSMSIEARRALFGYCDATGMVKNRTAAGIDAFVRMCDRLNEVKPGSVRVSEEVRRRLAELVRRESLARAISEFREMQGDDGQWPFLKKSLYPYQREGAFHLAGKGRALLADEMGLGKTVQAIAAALLLRETVGINRVLVVVPASLKGEWEDQIRFFSDADTELLYGVRHVRLARYADTTAFFLIANYEQVIRDWKEINDLLRPDLVILDEAQRIKNWKTKTSRNLKGLSSPYAFVLTGTPLENRIDELYSLVEFVDPALFGSLFRFNRQFYSFDAEGHNEGMCNLEKLHEATSQILLRRRKAAVEDELPGRMTKTYKTGMTAEQNRRYNEHLAEVASLVQLSKKRPLTPKEQERIQMELSMMRMLCDTCYIMDSKIKDSPKLDEFENVLDDIFADDPSRKVIVFSEWTRMLDLVIERLEKKGIGYALHTGQVNQKRRREEIRRFKEDADCRVFLASESGGVGLNLQVASVVANLDMPWNPARLEQRIARAWRKNQKRDVLVVNMVAAGTIEERMLQTLGFKQGLADFVLDAMGKASDFERQNTEQAKGKKKESAFMQRLASVMGEAVKVNAVATSKPKSEPAIPPEERLRATVEAECPGVERLVVKFRRDASGRSVGGAVAVGRGVGRSEIARRIAETHGVALPDSAVELIDPETWKLLQRLRDMGVISFCGEDVKDVIVRDAPDAAALEAAKRKAAVEKADAETERLLKMGELLVNGGFVAEGQTALAKAVALAAGTSRYALGAVPVDKEIEPVTADQLIVVSGELDLPSAYDDVLETAVKEGRLDMPDAVNATRTLIEECRVMWK